jgi:hypothetical protein
MEIGSFDLHTTSQISADAIFTNDIEKQLMELEAITNTEVRYSLGCFFVVFSLPPDFGYVVAVQGGTELGLDLDLEQELKPRETSRHRNAEDRPKNENKPNEANSQATVSDHYAWDTLQLIEQINRNDGYPSFSNSRKDMVCQQLSPSATCLQAAYTVHSLNSCGDKNKENVHVKNEVHMVGRKKLFITKKPEAKQPLVMQALTLPVQENLNRNGTEVNHPDSPTRENDTKEKDTGSEDGNETTAPTTRQQQPKRNLTAFMHFLNMNRQAIIGRFLFLTFFLSLIYLYLFSTNHMD